MKRVRIDGRRGAWRENGRELGRKYVAMLSSLQLKRA